jgi:hypothetical protein
MDFMKRAKWKFHQSTVRPKTGRYLVVRNWSYPKERAGND